MLRVRPMDVVGTATAAFGPLDGGAGCVVQDGVVVLSMETVGPVDPESAAASSRC
jgi:hypothetical protein